MQNILVVVDMQNDFIDGALGTKEAIAIVPGVKQKIRDFQGKVFFTRDTHGTDYMSTQEGQKLPVPHCIKGTESDFWIIRAGSPASGRRSKRARGQYYLHRPLHGYLRDFECAFSQGIFTGGKDYCRRFLLCRRYARKSPQCAGSYESMSDTN